MFFSFKELTHHIIIPTKFALYRKMSVSCFTTGRFWRKNSYILLSTWLNMDWLKAKGLREEIKVFKLSNSWLKICDWFLFSHCLLGWFGECSNLFESIKYQYPKNCFEFTKKFDDFFEKKLLENQIVYAFVLILWKNSFSFG